MSGTWKRLEAVKPVRVRAVGPWKERLSDAAEPRVSEKETVVVPVDPSKIPRAVPMIDWFGPEPKSPDPVFQEMSRLLRRASETLDSAGLILQEMSKGLLEEANRIG